ncbi:MAG: hypothetical protein J5I93_15925 [Pirellulaceae bacterium]|nr:hypothetical protein [Pirellulaceae bacterium]
MENDEIAARKTKAQPKFVICVRNDSFPASLELREVYRAISDPEASSHKMLRVIDESGEDYLYPDDCFVAVELPRAAELLFRLRRRRDDRADR